MPTIRIVNYPVYYPVKSDNPPDNPPDRPPERRWPWSASARLPPSTTLGATFKQGRTRSRCHLDYFGNGTARRRNTAVTVRKGMGGGSRTEVAVRRLAPYPASSTRSAPPLCEAWAPAWVGSAAMSAFWSFWLAWLQSSLHQAFLAEAFPFLRGILHMKAYKL